MNFHPRFRLRTLLIVVALLSLPCAYVAHEAATVRERQDVLDALEAAHVKPLALKPPQQPSWIRQLLGDTQLNFAFMVYSNTDAELMRRIKHAFPEAIL